MLLRLLQGFGCSRGTPVPGTEGISTAHPPNAGISQTCDAKSLHRGHGAPWWDHHKSQGNNVRAWKHQMPLIQRGWRASPGAQISERKVVPRRTPTMYLFVFALWKEILELESKASAWLKTMAEISTPQLWLPTTGAALWKEQSRTVLRTQRQWPRPTDLYLTAAAVTACGRKRGGNAHSPQKCTQLEKKRCFHNLVREIS